jgi:hypothetical protein
MIVLGLAGSAGSGKDTVADYLARRYGFVKFSFSDALYREVALAFNLEDESLLRDRATKEVPTDRLMLCKCDDIAFVDLAQRLIVADMFLPRDERPLSPRQILQWWGTEYRRRLDPNYWIKETDRWLLGLHKVFPYPEQRPQHFVNTSVRFENERAWVHSFVGGNVWHLRRDGNAAVHAHESEAGLQALDGERELWNNHTIDYLEMGVDQLLRTSAQFVRMEPPLPMLEEYAEIDPAAFMNLGKEPLPGG